MLYLGIDQHARQITISLHDENGEVLLAWQVSTQLEKINTYFRQLTRGAAGERRIIHSRPKSLRLQRLVDSQAASLPLPQGDPDPT